MDENVNAPLDVFDAATSPVPLSGPADAGPLEPSIPELDRFFGVAPSEMVDYGDREQMKAIWNHFAENSKSPGQVIRKISEAERSIEPPRQGESRLGKLYSYITLLREQESINDELSAYRK